MIYLVDPERLDLLDDTSPWRAVMEMELADALWWAMTQPINVLAPMSGCFYPWLP